MNEYLRLHRQMRRAIEKEGKCSQATFSVLQSLWAMGQADAEDRDSMRPVLSRALARMEAERLTQPAHVA